MTERDKMFRYARRSKIPNFNKYYLNQKQMDGIIQMLKDGEPAYGILYAVFCYGLAKGYRAAKKEVAQ